VTLYVVVCLLITGTFCFSDNAALGISLGIDAIWISASVYALARVLVHDSRLAIPPAAERTTTVLWPWIFVDRMCFPLHFGVVGTHWFASGVSEDSALVRSNAFERCRKRACWHVLAHQPPPCGTSRACAALLPSHALLSAVRPRHESIRRPQARR
jgi:hypothetical protein